MFCFWSQQQFALNNDRSTDIQFADLVEIIHFIIFKYNLKIFEGCTVIQFNKTKMFGCAQGSNPTCNSDDAVCMFFTSSGQIAKSNSLHIVFLLIEFCKLDTRKSKYHLFIIIQGSRNRQYFAASYEKLF